MRRLPLLLGTLLTALLSAALAPAQYPDRIPQAPEMCGPGFYAPNCCGHIYAPGYCVSASPQDGVNPAGMERIKESAKKVKQLQKEQIAALHEMADAIIPLWRRGLASFAEVYEARLLALKAELDAAEKESDRITLYKSIVDVLKDYETFAEGRVKSGREARPFFLKVKARRLEAEINLEQAKGNEVKENQ